MIEATVKLDDQPISSAFFGESRWLTEYITPENPDVRTLYKKLTAKGNKSLQDKLEACWGWVASQVEYVPYVKARITVENRTATQDDFWMNPSMTSRILIGNCVNKSFLLASLVRNALPPSKAHCVMGNLNQNGRKSGHAWVEVTLDDRDYILESTRFDMQPFVPSRTAEIYEPVLYANDQEVLAVPGRTGIQPYSAVYVDWLKEYLDWAYIIGRK
jgi:transglutaminase-like putative cysteine protease